jgi:antitoxin ParD1/3/4
MMSNFDIHGFFQLIELRNMSINVSVGKLEDFAREKVSQGEYGSVSEVVREGLRLLKRREEIWQAKVRAKIEEGMAQLRAGQTIPGDQVFSEVKQRIRAADKRKRGGK